MWENKLSQSLTSLFSEVALLLLLLKNNLKQLQHKKIGEEQMSIFHFYRKLQGTSGGHCEGPKITPTGTHWNSDDSTTALSSVTPPSSQFDMPVTLGTGNSWACDSFINQLFRWAGFALYSYKWKSPQSLTSAITDTKQCTHTTCNTYLNLSDTGATTRPLSNEPPHTTCRPADVLVHHKTLSR